MSWNSVKVYFSIFISLLVSTQARPLLGAENFSIILLPDTQYYSRSYPATYAAQTDWILNHRESNNIKFAVHLGDITHNNTVAEWQNAKAAHATLELAGFPYSMLPGNHDNPEGGRVRDTARYNEYFGPAVFADRSWYGGHYGATNDSNYTFFSASGLDFMVLSLEFAPRKEVISWAHEVIRTHPDHRVIIATHCYQNNGGDHRSDCACAYGLTGAAGNDLFAELVSHHSNVFLVVSGHVTDSELKSRTGLAGNTVYEVLTDYQSEPAGGGGWLRLVTFYPEENRIEFESLSATGSTGFSVSAYAADPAHPDHHFSIYYNMQSSPGYEYRDEPADFTDRTVNSAGSGQQRRPAVAADSAGNTVVVWEDDKDENGYYQIYARGFDRRGGPRLPDLVVNTVAAGQQYRPAIAMADNGDFVVVWEDDQDNNGLYQVMAAGFYSDGRRKFSDRQVNPAAGGQHRYPRVACDPLGNFVVTWQDDTDGNGWYQIHARGYLASGARRFDRLTVNADAAGQQLRPDIGMDAAGNFVVTWEDDKDKNGYYQILASGFSTTGSRRFGDITVNSTGAGQQYKPVIAMDHAGNFVVAWEDDQDGNGYYQILARGFYPGGTERIGDFTVNSTADGQQYLPAIGMDAYGNFVIAWEDDQDGNGYYQVLGRGFSADGKEAVADTTLNLCSAGQQYAPAVDLAEIGMFFSTWQDDKNENGYYEILLNGKLF